MPLSAGHKHQITAGDWYSSLFAPALAFASNSTIKVSQGFEGAEWAATSAKLKLGKQPASFTSPKGLAQGARRLSASVLARASSSSSRLSSSHPAAGADVSDPEGLEFEQMKFSPSGRHIATIARPIDPGPGNQVRGSASHTRRHAATLMTHLPRHWHLLAPTA